MLSTVSKIINSWSNAPMSWPVSWCVLACGHSGRCELRDSLRNQHDPENQITKVGDSVECSYCDYQAKHLEMLAALPAERFSHSRFRHHDSRGFGPGSIYVYEHDPKSPTGCRLFCSLDDTPAATDALRHFTGGSPLSPTERR